MIHGASRLNRSAYWFILSVWVLLASGCASKQFYYFSSLPGSKISTQVEVDSLKHAQVFTNELPEQYASIDSTSGLLPVHQQYSSTLFKHVQQKQSRLPRAGDSFLKQSQGTTQHKERGQAKQLRRVAKRQDKLPIPGKATVGFWLGAASLLLTIVGLAVLSSMVAFWPFIGAVASGLAGGIVSFIAIRRIKANPDKFGGLKRARAGFTFSFLSIMIWVILFFLVLAIVASWGY